ncbi:MAG TPA: LuxR C-terminal-related transcriptional regulator [Streptosporangiaceae bacterium]|nr:LuxR C-terminal-related transcriptional regulator [Streptosporangiaceae bacterium]
MSLIPGYGTIPGYGEARMTQGLTRHYLGELPVEVTGFVGRQHELTQLSGLLRAARLVTVTGPGGVGKTRIALRVAADVAARYADGVHLVSLSALSDPELLPNTVATSLGLPEQDVRSQLDAIIDHLRDRQLLLVLDTCEHLTDACAMLADVLLRTTQGITVLATSRQPLDVPGEHACTIAPMREADAIELFTQRAATVVPGFTVTSANRADVERLCRRLDQVPLALELATVRLRAIPLPQLVSRLEDRFRLLTGGWRSALAHQQTLYATTEWSHDLCTAAERLLWARLSVFAGSFDAGSAEDVCAGEGLPREEVLGALIGLVDKSVALRVEEDGTRYRLLDTIREFGAQKLAALGEESTVRRQHIARYLAMTRYFSAHVGTAGHLARYQQLVQEQSNIRAALDYALAAPDGSPAAELAGSLDEFWQMSVSPAEGRYWMGKVLERLPLPSPERARALVSHGYLACLCGDAVAGVSILEKGISIAGTTVLARGYCNLVMAYAFTERYQEALAAAEAGETHAAGNAHMLVALDTEAGYVHVLAGDVTAGLARCVRGLDRLGPVSTAPWQESYLHSLHGLCLFLTGDYTASAVAFCRALAMLHELGDLTGTGYALEGSAWLAAAQGRPGRAATLLGAAGPLWQLAGSRLGHNKRAEALHAQAEQAARAALGPEQYDVLYHRAATAPLGDVLRLAMDDLDTLPAQQQPAAAATDGADPGEALTRRELEIAELVAGGLSNREVAERLVISKRTVDAHMEHIFSKLGVSSRVQLVTWLTSGPATGVEC